jgi:tetratricopeptide (TPR) repeat protein
MLRYGAALFAAEQCDSAKAVARRGALMLPGDALGPMIQGQCLEQSGDHIQAIAIYTAFVRDHGDARGVAAVRARELMARREQATIVARTALDRESELAAQALDPQTVAVLPLAISGDAQYEPLGRGLAQMLQSDLALLQQFRMVERLQIGALLDELELGQTSRVDPATVARVGRLVRAGRMVQGLASIPPEGNVRIEASVVQSDGEVTSPEFVTGELRDLLQLEKELVVLISSRLGYQLSQAERQLILGNGTRDLSAFLLYSRGLIAEDIGDYSAAATHFSSAMSADPNFRQAQIQYEATAAADAVQGATPGEITSISRTVIQQPLTTAPDPVQSAVASVVVDIAATQAEATASTSQGAEQPGTTTTTAVPPPTATATGTTATVTGVVRIIFKLP